MKNLFIVSAPSGAGKTTLVNLLMQQDSRIVRPVAHTTRARRPGEVDGVHYYFKTRESFLAMVEVGGFVEYAEVHGNLYGTSTASIASIRDNQIGILTLDCEGAASARRLYPSCTTIFITVPLYVLRDRLDDRAQDKAEVIELRLWNALAEMKRAGEFDFVIENVDIEVALAKLVDVCKSTTA